MIRKHLFILLFVAFYVTNITGQEIFINDNSSIIRKDKNGRINRIRFISNEEITKAEEYGINLTKKNAIIGLGGLKNKTYADSNEIVKTFFNDILKSSTANFKKSDIECIDDNLYRSTSKPELSPYSQAIQSNLFKQYHDGIEVVDGFYNFIYKNNRLLSINGNFVDVKELKTSPTISMDKAKEIFANHKNIPVDSVTGFNSDLVIKVLRTNEIETNDEPKLVYYVYLKANSLPIESEEIGYIDAHTGDIISTAPAMIDLSGGYDDDPEGDWHQLQATFHTFYYNTQTAYTDFYGNDYHLEDYTYKIITRYITNPIYNDYNAPAATLTDRDNTWTTSEFREKIIALDVYWGLGKIYRRLRDTYRKFALGNNYIYSYVNYFKNDNASWHFENRAMYFGSGNSYRNPLVSIDVVAHELGHGITQQYIGWYIGNTNQYAFHEGLSDIWAVIMGQNIADWNHSWQIGNLVVNDGISTCIRSIDYPGNPSARTQIASTYNSTLYNSTTDPYIRGGVFSHWFYILTRGKSGVNDNGRAYAVTGVGLNKAEALIVNAVFNGSLTGTSTYEQIKDVFISVAEDMDGINSNLVKQVTNAWYAVGVGDLQYRIASTSDQEQVYNVYPNPAIDGIIYINNSDLGKTFVADNEPGNIGNTVKINSATTGSLVNIVENYTIGQAINVSNLVNDVYIISIYNNDGKFIKSLKFIKK